MYAVDGFGKGIFQVLYTGIQVLFAGASAVVLQQVDQRIAPVALDECVGIYRMPDSGTVLLPLMHHNRLKDNVLLFRQCGEFVLGEHIPSDVGIACMQFFQHLLRGILQPCERGVEVAVEIERHMKRSVQAVEQLHGGGRETVTAVVRQVPAYNAVVCRHVQ